MIQLITSLFRPLLALFILTLGSGLSSTYTSLRLEYEGVDHEAIGLVACCLYLGIFVGSLRLDRLISKFRLAPSFVIFASVATVLFYLQTVMIDPYFWAILRFFFGICTSGVFIVIESWLLIQSANHLRGFILAVYLAIFYLAMSLGQLLIHFSGASSNDAIIISCILSLLSIVPLLSSKVKEPIFSEQMPLDSKRLFKISPFGLSGVLISGIMLATMYSLVPIYAKSVGLEAGEIGNLMSLMILGGLLFQWPSSKIANTSSRKIVLMITTFSAICMSMIIAFTGHWSSNLLLLQIFLLGGFTFTIYPLSMAYAAEGLKQKELLSATSGFVLAYGLGAIIGPVIAPQIMNFLGIGGLFYFLASMGILLASIGYFAKSQQSDSETS